MVCIVLVLLGRHTVEHTDGERGGGWRGLVSSSGGSTPAPVMRSGKGRGGEGGGGCYGGTLGGARERGGKLCRGSTPALDYLLSHSCTSSFFIVNLRGTFRCPTTHCLQYAGSKAVSK